MGLPKPFSRPSINLGGPPEKREWHHTPTSAIAADDIVSGKGKVVKVESYDSYVCIHYLSGEDTLYDENDQVFAFIKV